MAGAAWPIGSPQKFGVTDAPVGKLRAAGPPLEQTVVSARNNPFGSRAGRSNSILFQLEFSKKIPAAARKTVFRLPEGSHAKPACGAKFWLGCRTRLPRAEYCWLSNW